MRTRSSAFGEIWRVLAYTLAIALGFIALDRLQLALFSAPVTATLLQRAGWLDRHPEAALQQEAAQLAAASQAALQRLPPGQRMATLRLGFELGYISQLVGGYAMSPPEVQAAALQRADAHVRLAREQARQLGLGEVQALAVRSLREFTELGQRYEADESGLAARVEAQLSPLHRHLLLLGAHLGGEAARVEDSGGRFALPPASLIRRHATLAGIAPAVWQPLAQEPASGEAPQHVQQRYRAALANFFKAIAAQDAVVGAGATP
jgi:hypothetical protein